MTNRLEAILIETGLIQFGLFGADEAPFRLNTGLLPSYPDVLKIAAEAATARLSGYPERFVCAVDAWSFGMALSLHGEVPLVYSLGTDAPGVHDLIGAYDVGHPAVLLVNVWDGDEGIAALIKKARQVGLAIDTICAIFSSHPPPDDLTVHALVDLPGMVRRMADDGDLPDELAVAIAERLR